MSRAIFLNKDVQNFITEVDKLKRDPSQTPLDLIEQMKKIL